MIPGVLNVMAGKEISAIIEISEATSKDNGLIVKATDIYDSSLPLNTNTDSSSAVDFSSIDLFEVSMYYKLILKDSCTEQYRLITTTSPLQSFDEAESSKTPCSAKSVSKKIKVVSKACTKHIIL